MKIPKESIDTIMFAPCGMNCKICYKHCYDKKPCSGYLNSDKGKPEHCHNCKIKDCMKDKGLAYYFECSDSERKKYIPVGFMMPDVLCSEAVFILPDVTLYHFGILTSNVHMAWVRAVCGILNSDYRYSKDIVYNNFPWCSPTEEQKAKIEKTTQGILDARKLYPDSSLADLYDEVTMPPELRKAHQQNDRAVMQAYGFSVKDMTESKCVVELMKMYKNLTNKDI